MVGLPPSSMEAEREKDIWSDVEVLLFLQTHQYGSGLSARERDRIYRREKSYRWMSDSVFKLLAGGAMVVAPRVAERDSIALESHRGMEHFGVQRVLDRLQKNY